MIDDELFSDAQPQQEAFDVKQNAFQDFQN